MAELDQLNVATLRWQRKSPQLIDLIFQEDPLAAYMKKNVREDFPGGSQITEAFIYNGLIGGPYLKGKEFDISEPQVEQLLQFNMKFMEMNVSLSKEDVQVLNTGPQAAFPLVKSRMQNGYMSIGAQFALSMYLNGINANYTAKFNGLPEALQDGAAGTASWDGNTYATYGTITRGGAVGTALNSTPVNVGGTIEYPTLEENYGHATFGAVEPNLIVTTVLCKSFIKEKFQPQQRFNNIVDPNIGFKPSPLMFSVN